VYKSAKILEKWPYLCYFWPYSPKNGTVMSHKDKKLAVLQALESRPMSFWHGKSAKSRLFPIKVHLDENIDF
jgi:hypothetical protein